MTRNRVSLGGIAALYFITLRVFARAPDFELTLLLVYLLVSIAIARSVWRSRGFSETRRWCALSLDTVTISALLHMRPEANAVLFGLYQWVVFGNGFRFGIGSLFGAIAAVACGFTVVIMTTSFWLDHLYLSFGLLLVLTVPTSYTSTLIWRLYQDRQAAERANSAKTTFLATVSHELRTPLNAILGSVALVETQQLNENNRENFDAVELGARNLLARIGSILDFASIESGRTTINFGVFSLADLLVEVRNLNQVAARAKGLALSIHIDGGVHPYIETDRSLLSVIVSNLTSNAVKFTETGSVLIDVAKDYSDAGDPLLRFQVIDTGIGIEPAASAHIFESFAQADTSILDRYGGTGLGLSISKGLAGALGGQIGVDSEQGNGSRFWFTIRYKAAEPPWMDVSASKIAAVVICGDPEAKLSLQSNLRKIGVSCSAADRVESALHVPGSAEPRRAGQVLVWYPENLSKPFDQQCRALQDVDPEGRVPRVLIFPRHVLPGHHRACFDTTIEGITPLELTHALRLLTRGTVSGPTADDALTIADEPQARDVRVLVADDNATNRQVLEKLLQRAGHQTVAVEDGRKALAKMVTGSFDVVLLDLNMPRMNGIDTVKAYRAVEERGKRLPIFAITADATPAAAASCKAAGMDGCLTKPIVPSRLMDLVASALPKTKVRLVPLPEMDHQGPARDETIIQDRINVFGVETYMSTVETFREEATSLLRQMDALIANHDTNGVEAVAHSLRGIAGEVGAAEVARISRWIELSPTSERLGNAGNLSLRLQRGIARFCRDVRDLHP